MKDMQSILALDLATKTGWAYRPADKKIIYSGVQDFSLRRGESHGMIFLRCRKWLKEFDLGEKSLIAYEAAHHRGGAATALCAGLVAEVQAFAAEHGFDTVPIHSATLKKFATGSGRAGKEEMLKKARELGFTPQDDNEADSIHLLRFVIENYD